MKYNKLKKQLYILIIYLLTLLLFSIHHSFLNINKCRDIIYYVIIMQL